MRSCNSFRPSSKAILPLLVCATLALLAPGQAQDPSGSGQQYKAAIDEDENGAKQGDFVERSRVDLALIEVVVLDSKGRHVRDLPASAFTVIVNGEALPVLSVDEIDISPDTTAPRAKRKKAVEPPTPAEAEPAPDEAAPAAYPEPTTDAADDEITAELLEAARREVDARLEGPRWFAMIFDGYNNIAPRRMGRVRIAAKKWLDENLRDWDMAAVYEINPYLYSVSGFTSDVPLLKDSIDKVRVLPGSSISEDLFDQKLDPNNAAMRENAEIQLRNAASFGATLLEAERDQYYGNLQTVAETLGGLEGTKAILLFSGGFPLTMSTRTASTGGFTPRFKEMLQNLEMRGIRVFSYDIGEEGGFTDADQQSNYRVDLEQMGLGTEWLDTMQIGTQTGGLNAHREILSVLGNETGGRFWPNYDYGDGLRAADDDLSHYYLLGFRPTEIRSRKSGYQRLKIKVRQDGKDLKAISRTGRFQRPAQQRRKEALAAAETQAAATTSSQPEIRPLEVACRPTYHPGMNGQTLAVLLIQIAGPLNPISIGSGQSILDLEVIVGATLDGAEVVSGSRNVRLQVPQEAVASLQNGVQIREALLLPPTQLDLSVEIRLNGQDRSGRWSLSKRIPTRDGKVFGLTDLTLLHPTQPTPLIYDVFIKNDPVFGTEPGAPLPDPLGGETAGRPPLYVEGGFPREVPLLAQVRVTAPPRPSDDQQSPLRLDWELLPGVGGEPLAPPIRYRKLELQQGADLLEVMIDMDLSAVQPGEYTLRLTAKNLVAEGEDVRSYPITIAP